jgi:crotonobetainyl-CoA:carnitine CoA-transferase CaiB-like acyl-CoA transferase
LGAEIIKVEPPSGDPTRSLVRGGPSGTFIAYSHGKKSVCIDLARPEGHAALCALLRTADALVHNLAPKAARKLKLTQEDCAAINPKLIYCHIRGYGAGPQEDDLASNPVAEASTGVMEANQVNGRPSRLGPSYHDQFAGAYAVIGILASMLQTAQGKKADPVEVGLYETGLHVASRDLVGVQLKTQLLGRPEREPHGEFSMPGYGAYRTSDERWIYLLMLSDAHWLKFCQAMELPVDDALASLRQRKKLREQVETLVKSTIAARAFEDVSARLKAAGMGCTEVLPLERVLDAPQALHPGKLRNVPFRGFEFAVPEFPRLHSGNFKPDMRPPPNLGEHTAAILKSAGVGPEEYTALLGSGAIEEAAPDAFAWAPVRREARTQHQPHAMTDPVERKELHHRQIDLRFYQRSDGLYEVEGRLLDRKTQAFRRVLHDRDTPAGTALHDITVRLVIDGQMLVHDASASLAATPFELCREAANTLAPLKGLRIGGGWNKRIRELLGGAASCTHIVELLGPMATTAYQGLAPQRLARLTADDADAHRSKIDSCYSYGRDREVVARLWPREARQADGEQAVD